MSFKASPSIVKPTSDIIYPLSCLPSIYQCLLIFDSCKWDSADLWEGGGIVVAVVGRLECLPATRECLVWLPIGVMLEPGNPSVDLALHPLHPGWNAEVLCFHAEALIAVSNHDRSTQRTQLLPPVAPSSQRIHSWKQSPWLIWYKNQQGCYIESSIDLVGLDGGEGMRDAA